MILLFLMAISGFEYLLVDPIAERVGMGYALCGDGHNVYYNTAGLNLNVSTSYSASYLNYIAGTHFGYIDYESNILGVGIRYFYSGKIKKTDPMGQELGDFSTNFIDLSIGKGFAMSEVMVGVSGKLVYEQIDTLYALGVGTDIGALYFLPQENIQLGITLKNLGISAKPFVSEKELFPYEINLGIARRFDSGWFGLDIVRPALISFGIRVGGEYELSKLFALRASYNSLLSQVKTDNGLDFFAGITLGFAVTKGVLKINYSYTPYFTLGQAHKLTIRIGG
ncbi:MAG: hypothetical protein ABIL20_07320 [candidate division WOR-3 bacterium]